MFDSIEDGCYKKTIGQCANNDVVGEEAITMLTWFFMNNYTRCDKGKEHRLFNYRKLKKNGCCYEILSILF